MIFVWSIVVGGIVVGSIVKAVLAAFFGETNEDFLILRAQANVQGDKMSDAFERSRRAHARGERELAKKCKENGMDHKAKMDELNRRASDLIFAEKNKDRGPGEVDLHGLYVKEAIERTEAAIDNAQRLGIRQLRLIVGKGLHSQGGVAKIRPAVEDLLQLYWLRAEVDPRNEGVLVVFIDSSEFSIAP